LKYIPKYVNEIENKGEPIIWHPNNNDNEWIEEQ
jgi:hypothetical protein